MSVDIYSPCPCGSGKKLKFCCHAFVDDMDRAIRLVESNQPRVAMQQLDALAKKHPLNAWIDTTRGMLLLDLNEGPMARDVIRALLEEHPDNELAIVLYAAAMVQAEGFDKAKRSLHRAFQKSAKKLPALVGDLAASLSNSHAANGHMMASREHLALALRLAPEDKRQRLFVHLLELDGADEIPYPLRGSHQLPTITGPDEIQQEVRKGQKYAAIGCWSVAADVFMALANSMPENASLWHSVGLCRAWDGDEKSAAEALHRAARHYGDKGIAVECETIAQILDDATTTDVIDQCLYRANVHTVSRLLTVLDGQPRLSRVKDATSESDQIGFVAKYLVISDAVDRIEMSQLNIDNIPRVQGEVSVFDADPKNNRAATLLLAGFRGAGLDDAKAVVTAASGDLIEWSTEVPQPEVVGNVSSDSLIFMQNWHMADSISLLRRRELFKQFWDHVVYEVWLNRPARALDGKTPLQASTDESYRVPLLGAIYALDATAQGQDKSLDIEKLFARLQVSPLPAVSISNETNVGAMSIMQLHRLPIDKLTDHQLVTVVNRSMLVRHESTLYHVLKIAVDRPECASQFDEPRVYRMLVDICSNEGRRDEAIMWLDRARKLPLPDGKTAFQAAWAWDMIELATRLEDPSDPDLKVVLNRFVTYYAPKVPQVRPHIEQMLQKYGIPSPWDSVSIIVPGGEAATATMWNPGSPAPAQSGGTKLWLPGQ